MTLFFVHLDCYLFACDQVHKCHKLFLLNVCNVVPPVLQPHARTAQPQPSLPQPCLQTQCPPLQSSPLNSELVPASLHFHIIIIYKLISKIDAWTLALCGQFRWSPKLLLRYGNIFAFNTYIHLKMLCYVVRPRNLNFCFCVCVIFPESASRIRQGRATVTSKWNNTRHG